MKLWCDCCDKVQPVEVTDERCAKTYAAYQDIVCTECRLVIAAGNDIRRTWVGLTDEDIYKMTILMGFNPEWKPEVEMVYTVVRNLEAKLKEKNT